LDKQGAAHYSRYQAPPVAPCEHEIWSPKNYPEPGQIWTEKAGNLLADCQNRLTETDTALSWLTDRGISADISRTYGLGYNLSSKGKDRYRARTLWGLPEKFQGKKEKKLWIPRGLVIPAYNRVGALIQLRIRRLDEDVQAFAPDIRYLPLDGSSMATMVLHPEAEVFAVVEGGLDAILLAGIMEGKIGVMTTWNSAARPDVFAHGLLSKASLILGALDYDQAGDREQGWWQKQYRHYRRLPALPGDAKDPGDAAKAGADLKAWLVAGLPRGLQIKLGFVGRRNPLPITPPVQPVVTAPPQPEEPQQAEVVEIELIGGTVVYVTNDQAQWQLLAEQGKPVFSQNELERLQVALTGMDASERAEALLRAIEVKEIFGGYIQRGRGGVATDCGEGC
jgi:hypothetical protein